MNVWVYTALKSILWETPFVDQLLFFVIILEFKSDLENEIFWCQGIFRINFDFKNGYKNEFKDKNEKSWSWSRYRVSNKIDLKAVWPRNGHAAIVGVKKKQVSAAYLKFLFIFVVFTEKINFMVKKRNDSYSTYTYVHIFCSINYAAWFIFFWSFLKQTKIQSLFRAKRIICVVCR